MFEKVGSGEISNREVIEVIFPHLKENKHSLGGGLVKKRVQKSGNNQLPVKGLIPGRPVHISKCCHPILGDRIVGIVSEGKGIMVHTIGCEALDVYTDAPEAWLDLSWQAHDDNTEIYIGRVDIMLKHVSGSLASVLALVAQDDGNVSNIKFTERSVDIFRIELDLEVRDVKHLTDVMSALRASKFVNSIERAFA